MDLIKLICIHRMNWKQILEESTGDAFLNQILFLGTSFPCSNSFLFYSFIFHRGTCDLSLLHLEQYPNWPFPVKQQPAVYDLINQWWMPRSSGNSNNLIPMWQHFNIIVYFSKSFYHQTSKMIATGKTAHVFVALF